MDIKTASMKLRKLGIPGTEKEQAITKKARKRDPASINKIVEKYIEKILLRWAYKQGLIDLPTERGNGAGNKSVWPPNTVEQTAAVWAVKERYRTGEWGKKRLTKDQISVIRRAAAVLDKEPFAMYMLRPIKGPLSSHRVALNDIEMKFVSEDIEGLNLFPGRNSSKKAECLNELVVVWVAAREKVRAWASHGISARYIVENYPNFAKRNKIEYSQIDPWQTEVPCPWKINRKATVNLYYWSRPSKKGIQFGATIFPIQRTLTDSDRDEIILYENGVDTRTFFVIDVGNRKGWARAERKRIDSEYEKLEHKLQSLGVKTIDFNALAELEQVPAETLSPSDQEVLTIVQEMLKLAWYRHDLSSFGE